MASVEASGVPAQQSDEEAAVVRKVLWRIIPFGVLLYLMNYIDRVNISMAKLSMQADAHLNPEIANGVLVFSDAVYAFGASIFFIAYFLFEIPSNLIQEKVGPRRWMARIVVSWGVVSTCFVFVNGPISFYVLRFLLGVAEAGFFPGMILYLSYWIPSRQRARAGAFFLTSTAIAGVVGNPLGGYILYATQSWPALQPWQWLFLLEGLPTIILGFVALYYLTDLPKDAHWLSPREREVLMSRLAHERHNHPSGHAAEMRHAFANPKVWILGLLYSFLMFGFYTINYWTPTIIRASLTGAGVLTSSTGKHIEYTLVGLLAAIPFGAAAIGMVFIGLHSDRTNERRWHVAGSALVAVVGLVFAAGAARVFPPSLQTAATITGLSIAAIGIWGTLGPFWTLPPAILTGTAAAAGIALVNSLGNLGGGFFGPNILASLKKSTGSDLAGLMLGAGILLLAAITTAVIRIDHAPPAFPIDPNADEEPIATEAAR